jgi:ribonuclease HI
MMALGLGHGSNNLGELFGVFIALKQALALLDSGAIDSSVPVLIFSDSLLVIGFLTDGWRLTADTDLGHSTRTLLRKLKQRTTVRLYWVRGHINIIGNEMADTAAKQGANASKTSAWALCPAQPTFNIGFNCLSASSAIAKCITIAFNCFLRLKVDYAPS